jgi:hypothetical protein
MRSLVINFLRCPFTSKRLTNHAYHVVVKREKIAH